MTQQSATSLLDPALGRASQADWNQRAGSILLRLLKASNGVGFSGTITTAKLTTGGTEGSMTFVNGILASSTAAT